MKKSAFHHNQIFLLALFLITFSSNSQAQNITKSFKNKTIKTASQYLKDYYVLKELGEEAANYLNEVNNRGDFKTINDIDVFASEVSKVIYAITYDKHISVSVKQKNQIVGSQLERQIESRMNERNYFRKNTGNFKTIEKLHNNIGYLDLRGFYSLSWGKSFADHAMNMLSTSDAIIIDLRSNYGGRGDMVSYLLGHFFEKPIITGRSIKRKGDNFIDRENYSTKISEDKIMADIPLFILTSSSTFSAAEAFAFPLKVYQRAILIGETTKGGANAGDVYSLNDQLNIFIPDVAGKHPLKDESYDVEGITPNIKARNGDALGIAINLATVEAEKYKLKNEKVCRALLKELNSIITTYEENPKPDELIETYINCRKQNLIFEEWEINYMAYQFFNQKDKLNTAEILFKVNTILYPESANTFDSYAESLLKNDKIDLAILNYEKAISLSQKYNLKNVKLFKSNLEGAKKIKQTKKRN